VHVRGVVRVDVDDEVPGVAAQWWQGEPPSRRSRVVSRADVHEPLDRVDAAARVRATDEALDVVRPAIQHEQSQRVRFRVGERGNLGLTVLLDVDPGCQRAADLAALRVALQPMKDSLE